MGIRAAMSNPSSLKGIAESSSRLENMNSEAELKPHTAFNAGLEITGKNVGLSRLEAGRDGKKWASPQRNELNSERDSAERVTNV